MSALLLSPHADDEVLFAGFTCLRERPHVAIVFDEGRRQESARALNILGCSWSQFPLKPGTDSEVIETFLWGLFDPVAESTFDVVYAPAVEPEGHEEHNQVGALALSIFPNVRGYLTYAPRGERSRHGTEVVPEPWMIAKKLAALACYESQIIQDSTRPWFYELLDMREWMAQMEKWLVTSCRAVTGSIIRAESAEKAAEIAFGRKKLSGMPGGVEMGSENFVTVYPLGGSQEFYPVIEYELTGVTEKP